MDLQLTRANNRNPFSDNCTPRRRATYPAALLQAYNQAITAIVTALKMPIRYAGPDQWSLFLPPARLSLLLFALALPGTLPIDLCVLASTSLWETFYRLSLYVEALCIHEWSLFTESVAQDATASVTRGTTYALLTARPHNRRPLTWERNQVDILLHEQVSFTCPWIQRQLTQATPYDLDHLLPLAVYPINELWNLLLVDREFNQRQKRDRVLSAQRLSPAAPCFAVAYANYTRSPALNQAVRADAALRFLNLSAAADFATGLSGHVVNFINEVAAARYVTRFD